MKKFIALFCIALMEVITLMASVPEPVILENLTSRIMNADFMADEPVTATIKTYDYDMPDGLGLGNGGTDRFGQQEVTGWVATTPSDNIWMAKGARTDGANACAAGVFSYPDPEAMEYPGLGGEYYPPFAGDGNEGNALGLVAVWGHNLQYTQDITLPAGGYMLLVKVYNAAGAGDVTANNFGFFTEGNNFVSTRANYPVDEWVEDAIYFQLTEETAGSLSLGFAFGGGSGSAPHLFVDNVALYRIDESYFTQIAIDELKEGLLALIDKANAIEVDTEEAQAIYDNPNASLEQVQNVLDELKTKIATAITGINQSYYESALESIDEGRSYHIFTNVDGKNFYMMSDGYLTDNVNEAKIFSFTFVNASGTFYPTGWNLGCKFTNPTMSGSGGTGNPIQQGHIIVGNNNRNDWERQVFFLKDDKYAIRATNANSENWGANTYWTVTNTSSEIPNADYSLTPEFVWQIEHCGFESGGLCYEITHFTTPLSVSVSKPYTGKYLSSSISIPDTVIYNGNAYGVTGIMSSAFRYCTNLTEITIPNSIFANDFSDISIAEDAFLGCTGLSTVILNNNRIASQMSSHISLQQIFGPQVTSYILGNRVTSIGLGRFEDNANLTEVSISNSVTIINSFAFYGCSNLTSVNIPSSVTRIGRYVFAGCI